MATDQITKILVAVEGLQKDMKYTREAMTTHLKDEMEWRKNLNKKFSSKWVEWAVKGTVGAVGTTIVYKLVQLAFMSGGAITTFHLINKYYV